MSKLTTTINELNRDKFVTWPEVNSATYPPTVRIESGDSYIRATQSLVDSDGKVASHLDPVLILIGPNPKVKADCGGAKLTT